MWFVVGWGCVVGNGDWLFVLYDFVVCFECGLFGVYVVRVLKCYVRYEFVVGGW